MKHITLLTLAFVLSSVTLFATGPSYINSELIPIARNKKGDVLCKTRYEENQMGGYGYLDIYYGLCVLTKKSIVEFPVFKLDPENMESGVGDDEDDKYMFLYHKWNKWFTNDTDEVTQQETVIINKYVFDDFDMSPYLKPDTMSIKAFQQKYKTNLSSKKMKTLRKAKTLRPDEYTGDIVVSYVFDNKIICKSAEYDEKTYGLQYNFKTNLFGGIPYEWYQIDGVLFK